MCHVHLDDSAIRLQLNDDSTVDDQVQTVAAVYDRRRFRGRDIAGGHRPPLQRAFNESGSQSEMDGACRFNDSKDQALAGFHARPNCN